jgi:hypothetical protein
MAVFSHLLRGGLCLLAAAALLWPMTHAARAATADGVSPAGAEASPRLQTDAEALVQDAQEYARIEGISLDTAMARLHAQQETVALTDSLRTEFADRLAGISIEHQPSYRIVVLLTGPAPVAQRTIMAGGLVVPITFRTGAAATREQVIAAIRLHQAAIRARLKVPPGMGFDPRSGELVIVVHAYDLAATNAAKFDAEFEALTGVPVQIRPQGREQRNLIAGGTRVDGPLDRGGRDSCTTGFVVSDGAQTGVITAAHCPDQLSYRDAGGEEIALTFIGQWGDGYQDVQINSSGQAQRPIFYADARKRAARELRSWRNRSSTRAGDVVCHRGESSGYSCSEIELTDYAPPGDLCNGPCAPAWVTVGGPACKGGDSGGPVFNGSIAFGILKGASYAASGRCDFYYYMSTDYLPEGWSLLR